MLGGTMVDKFTSKRADRVNDGSNIFKGRRNSRIGLEKPNNVHNNAVTMMARRLSTRRYVAFSGAADHSHEEKKDGGTGNFSLS